MKYCFFIKIINILSFYLTHLYITFSIILCRIVSWKHQLLKNNNLDPPTNQTIAQRYSSKVEMENKVLLNKTSPLRSRSLMSAFLTTAILSLPILRKDSIRLDNKIWMLPTSFVTDQLIEGVKATSNSDRKDKFTYVRYENHSSARNRKSTEQKSSHLSIQSSRSIILSKNSPKIWVRT